MRRSYSSRLISPRLRACINSNVVGTSREGPTVSIPARCREFGVSNSWSKPEATSRSISFNVRCFLHWSAAVENDSEHNCSRSSSLRATSCTIVRSDTLTQGWPYASAQNCRPASPSPPGGFGTSSATAMVIGNGFRPKILDNDWGFCWC